MHNIYWIPILYCFEHWGELNNLNLNVAKTKLLLIGTRSKLSRHVNPEPIRLYDRPVPFVKSYNYLGVILDSEMTLRPFFNHVKKIVYSKIFMLTKIRSYLTEFAAIMIYKHTILPYFEYAGFLLTACTKEDRKDLQICQNDALRVCTHIKLLDHVRIDDLHDRCKITSLEQRRCIQLLLLMYRKSKDNSLSKVFNRNTRQSNRFTFKTDSFEVTLYKRSPYYIGAKMWNDLPAEYLDLPDIYCFKARLKKDNRRYQDML